MVRSSSHCPRRPRVDQSLTEFTPKVLGLLADRYPSSGAYWRLLLPTSNKRFSELLGDGPIGFSHGILSKSFGWDRLAQSFGGRFTAMGKPFADEKAELPIRTFIGEYPIRDALQAADKIKPGIMAQAVTIALHEAEGSPIRDSGLEVLAATLDGSAGDLPREIVLGRANDDSKLFEFARSLQNSGQTEWLVEQIKRDLGGPSAGIIARGLTLAGFLRPSFEGERLWSTYLSSPPATGWLTGST